jgi:hypothetical protein
VNIVPNQKKRRAFLLRCWQEGEPQPGEEPHWRFSLEEVLPKGPRQGFPRLEALLAFLRAEFTRRWGQPED